MGFWTRVRLPPNPFGNTVKSRVSAIDKMKDTQKSTHSKKKESFTSSAKDKSTMNRFIFFIQIPNKTGL